MKTVRDALLEGRPAPEGALSQLTPGERSEIAALTATSRLLRETLQQPAPAEASEAQSLRLAQEALSSAPHAASAEHNASLWERIVRLWRVRRK